VFARRNQEPAEPLTEDMTVSGGISRGLPLREQALGMATRVARLGKLAKTYSQNFRVDGYRPPTCAVFYPFVSFPGVIQVFPDLDAGNATFFFYVFRIKLECFIAA
jgi:hypothetical protein